MGYCEKCRCSIEGDHRLCAYCYEEKKKEKESSGVCFITSACVESKDLPDDCFELQTLRNFRDNILLKTKEGKKIVEEYYRIAPKIVKAINYQQNSREVYDRLYLKIQAILKLIEKGNNVKAIDEYANMVNVLKLKYLTAQ